MKKTLGICLRALILLGFNHLVSLRILARPAGIEPATPAFGGHHQSRWLLVRPSKIKDLPYPEFLHLTVIYRAQCSKSAAGIRCSGKTV